MNNEIKIDYISRINAVFDYIEKNIDQNISLDELAAVSHFSKYHFSRIFDAIIGETPFEFIKRIRLEKAASLLRINPDKTITKIALKCGFNDLAVFSRNFSNRFEVSPTGGKTAQRRIAITVKLLISLTSTLIPNKTGIKIWNPCKVPRYGI